MARNHIAFALECWEFPGVYLEHPLAGDPFLDVTVLLGPVEPGTRISSPAAGEHAAS